MRLSLSAVRMSLYTIFATQSPISVDTQIYFSYTQNIPKILIRIENIENRGVKRERASGYAARCALRLVSDNGLGEMGREL
jgi:hypothetical protein